LLYGQRTIQVKLNIPNAVIHWSFNSNIDSAIYSSPLTLYSRDVTSIYAFVTYNSNGCTAQKNFGIQVENQTSDALVNGLVYNPIPLIFDTLNCLTPTISIACAANNGTANWMINNQAVGDTLHLSIADTVGMDPNFRTKTYVIQTIHNNSGCDKEFNVTVLFDFAPPFISSLPDQTVTCSQNTIVLEHQTTGSNVSEGWLDTGNNQTGSNTLTTDTSGVYYYQVQDLLNGCINIDTVAVVQSNELILDLLSDTLVCDGQAVDLSVTVVNNNEPTTFQWSDGNNTATITAIGGTDSVLTVIVQNQSGCIGYDTVVVNIPAPIVAEIKALSLCKGGSLQVLNVSGGTGNYQYALEQGAWQNNTFFDSLYFGTYAISVMDDLGCVFDFTQTIDGSEEHPDMNFLVSTYNKEGDTLAIVNISNYTGFDSIVWVLPSNAVVHSSNDSLLIVSIVEGNWYDVTLRGYIDTCDYEFTKSVYFGEHKPDYSVDYDSKGIQNLNIFPNPTTGQFTIAFDLGVSQHYSIVVTNLWGQPISSMNVSGTGTHAEHQMTFPAGLPTENYRIHIVSDFDAKQFSIILEN
jgi:hypothetical protein